ncbi:phytanoyl-CoA dioxygenase family protein [bacterium AH-315-E10]|nr:phytanoyl-CoA dioxygenase family protein [bacterium AH-315-E10]
MKSAGVDVLKKGKPEVVDGIEPVMITGEPGDVVLTHHNIIHTAAPNHTPHIRYAVIFRFSHIRTKEVGTRALIDLWEEWDGLELEK